MEASEAIKELHKIRPRGGIIPQKRAEALDMAIQALEKQIPKKVKNSGERIPFEWYCPTCGEILCDDGYKDTDIKYCEQCGQVLDWENT